MKKLFTTLCICALVLACLFVLPTRAEAATAGDYTYEVKKGKATITGYTGDGGDITIPATLGGYPVTAIGDWAFGHCDSLTSVTIGSSVTTIGEYAFFWCTSLTSVTIGNSVTTIGADAFFYCDSLTSLTIGNSVTTIGADAFFCCASLTSVTIPDSVTTIGEGAFCDCLSLTSVSIPSSVTSIGERAFCGCASLSGIWVERSNSRYTSDAYGVLFNKDKTQLIQAPGAISGSYTIPNSVTSIGNYAFSICTSLTRVTIPDRVTTIGEYAFNWCTSLTRVAVGNSVTTIGEYAFYWCTSLTRVAVGNSVTTIGEHAFYNCSSLTSVAIPKSVTQIEQKAFDFCKKIRNVYYNGNTDSWWNIDIGIGNESLKNAKRSYVKFVAITKQPASVVVANGKSASVTVSATGEGLTYKWYYKNKGATKFSLSSIKTNTYATTMKAAVSGRQVYCKITDEYGNTVTTKTVTLSMKATITKQPTSVSVANGKTAKVTVSAAGEGLSYKWYYKNKGATKFSLSSIKTNTYATTMKAAVSGRQVYCKITDKYGNTVTTKTVTLSMKATITKQPVSVTVAKGATAKVTVKATGDGLTYRWYYKNPGDKDYTYTDSFKGNSYYVTMNAARNGRRVLCRVYDKYGNVVKSNSVTLSMKQTAKITKQPVSVTVANGKTVSTTVKATGDGLSYKWYFKSKGATKFSLSSVKTSTYSVKMSSAVNGRSVYCIIKDKYGNTVKTNTVTLRRK